MPEYNKNTAGEPKYQIFISATYEDLKDYRERAIREVLRAEQIPIAMEHFVPSDDDQWKIIERYLSTSGCMILIVGNQYGSTNEKGESYTEKEYARAVENKIPILAFITEKNNNDYNGKNEELKKFKEKIKKSRLISYSKDLADFEGAVASAIAKNKHAFKNPWTFLLEENTDGRENTYDKERVNIIAKDYEETIKCLKQFPVGNTWNDEAVAQFEEYEILLNKIKEEDKWSEFVPWTGGRDFRYLFEVRTDANMIGKEQKDKGLSKSFRYVKTEETGEMLVMCWYV